MGSAEVPAQADKPKRSEDYAYAKKVMNQMTADSKDMGDVTSKITKMLINKTEELTSLA